MTAPEQAAAEENPNKKVEATERDPHPPLNKQRSITFVGLEDTVSRNSRRSEDEDDEDDDDDDDLTESENGESSTDETVGSQGTSASRRNIRSVSAPRLRSCVILMFVVLAVVLPTIIYIAARNAEVGNFESEFTSLSNQVVTSFESKLGSTLYSIDAMSIAATADAIETNSTWPFVTVRDFDLLGASSLALADALFISINPLVELEERQAWEEYALTNLDWLYETDAREAAVDAMRARQEQEQTRNRNLQDAPPIVPFIYRFNVGDEEGPVTYENSTGPYFPAWQVFPLNPSVVNYSPLTHPADRGAILEMQRTNEAVISRTQNLDEVSSSTAAGLQVFFTDLMQRKARNPSLNYTGEPITNLYYPVFDSFDLNREMVAMYASTVYWPTFFTGVLPPSASGIVCVMENTCGDVFSYEINGEGATFLGYEDAHDRDWDYLEVMYTFASLRTSEKFSFSDTSVKLNEDKCAYSLRIYPSDELHESTVTSTPLIYCIVVAAVFIVIGLVAISYDWLVQRRMQRILKSEKESRQIVHAAFPRAFRERMMLGQKNEPKKKVRGPNLLHPKMQLKSFLHEPNGGGDVVDTKGGKIADHEIFMNTKPIADLFPHCTTLFADIYGFSAWSSEREPEQVFTLLETVFRTFDKLARKRAVFKVETIADCYVAVTGLPEPQVDHAVRMVRFAREALSRVNNVTKSLELTLGPDTGDLRFRFGLHSGQITAGILMGSKSRFQLFGDTVNTASRMQSTGQSNRIQLSEQTANLLILARKSGWIQPRRDLINVKGKGIVQTYWVVHSGSDDVSVTSRISGISSADMGSITDPTTLDENKTADGFAEDDMWGDDGEQVDSLSMPTFSKVSKNKRLVNWLTEVMTIHLKELIAQRGNMPSLPDNVDPEAALKKGEMVRDEVIEAFTLPKFKAGAVDRRRDSKSTELKLEVVSQLKEYVTAIADQYQDNYFHNFEHASHVTMSVMKFLNRIVVPEDVNYHADSLDTDLHEYTFGITSDALSQFAVVFSALIHDVNHRGVPNSQLSKESPALGEKYQNQSVAEQNSVDIAWNLLMDPQFKDLRQCMFTNVQDVKRFRQYVVNLVIATDIFDKDMKELRNSRWKKAFDEGSIRSSCKKSEGAASATGSQTEEGSNLKATIVLEHIIQAADVSHTMQHWNVYTKWNERLFHEMYAAFDNGRAEKDPSEGWYKGEIWFFDNYIIPLAKKLEECGVFGVSSDECLSYALTNRKEWEHKGEEVVKEMVERYHKNKGLEIGGFTQEEINAFSAKELEYILELLMKKGRAFGSFKSSEKVGQRTAAQAWLDSLEIHEICPAAGKLKDPTMIFPVFSGLCVFIKGGKIIQDRQCSFEQGLATKFVVDAEKYGDPVHHARALAMLCEVQAKAGKYETALKTFAKIQEMYDPQKLSQAICNAYGTDRAVHAYSQSALWYHQLCDTENSLKACEYVIDDILPYMDPSNILNSCELLFPIIRVLKPQGQEKRTRDMFDEHVVQNYSKHEIKFTPCRCVFEPMLMLLGICHDPVDYPTFEEDLAWLLEEKNGIFDDFIGNIFAKLGWSPNTLSAELCLRFAKKLYAKEDGAGDMDKVKALVEKGCLCIQKAEPTMRDDDWEIELPIAYEIHEPVAIELREFAGELGIVAAASERSVQSVDAPVEKPLRTMFGLVQLS